jgi:ParE-like toxin of type II ParDE toxin-antitoxin system
LGEDFALAVDQAFERIVANSARYGFSVLGTRRCKLKRFPYNIHYIVEGSLIFVIAVFHAKRDQDSLRQRL